MIRTFKTHKIRKQQELTGSYWTFSPCEGVYAGKSYQVMTPSCWETYPDFAGYRGESVYRTQFQAGGNIRLEFKGVSHTATVWLDGKKIASHYNAYTIFSTVVKGLDRAEHKLEVRVDNRFSSESALHIPNDYMSYGGISRPVVLEELKDVYIEWLHVTPQYKAGIWKALLELKLQNISDESKCILACIRLAGEEVRWQQTEISANSAILLTREVSFADVHTWEPQHPNLYTIHAVLEENGMVTDDYIDRFGFRQITIVGKKLLLNGNEITIKGFCRHEDHPLYGCALPFEAMTADLALLHHLGANSVRTVHYPNDELFLDLCDEQGILVWEENHARGLSLEDMQNPNFEHQAEEVIREMVPSHYNHPSIYIWGILNECASDTAYGKACYEKQLSLIRTLDQSRPLSFASCKFKTDICLGLPDVVSYNIYPLWYHNTPAAKYLDDLYQWVQNETEGAGKPFLITEIGAGAIYGCHDQRNSKWTEEYQAEALRAQLEAVLSYENCMGVYIWQFCDVRVSEEWFEKRPRCMNNKGVVDEYRRRKLSYTVVKEIFEA